MCGPVGALLGGAVSAVGSIMQGQAAAAAYKAQARAAKYEAWATRMQGQSEASRTADKGLKLRGDQIIAYSSEGLAPEGTVADVIGDSAQEVEFDKMMIRTNAENKARGKDYEAKIANMQAKSAKTAGMIGGISAMVGGVASAFNSGGFGSAYTRQTTGGGSSPYVNQPAQVVVPLAGGAPVPTSRTGFRTGSIAVGGNIPAYGYPDISGGPR